MTLSSAMQAPSTPSTLGELFGGIIDELSQFGVLQWSFLLVLVLALFLEITMVLKATPKRRKSPRENSLFDRKKLSFQRMRVKAFPPPYANGWYMVAYDEEIANGQIKSLSALGRHFVIFRDDNGKVGCLNAFCPHIGAHLGQGGKLVNGCIQCPFHHMTFDTDGKCVQVPYSDAEKFPSSVRAKSYYTGEHHGMVFLWFDAEDRPPLWELNLRPELDKCYFGGQSEKIFYQHQLEMAENSADWYHFTSLHGELPWPSFLSSYCKLKHDCRLAFDDQLHHMCYFHNSADMYIMGKWRFPVPTQHTTVHMEGPGLMLFEIDTVFGKFYLYKCMLPVGPFELLCQDTCYAVSSVPSVYTKLLGKIASSALEQDRLVWESKVYNTPPVLVKGDGPWFPFRRWWRTHLSESSEKIAIDRTDW